MKRTKQAYLFTYIVFALLICIINIHCMQILNYSLLLFAGKEEAICDDPNIPVELNNYKIKIDNIIPETWHSENTSNCRGFYLKSNKKYNFKERNRKFKDNLSIYIGFEDKKSIEYMDNKINYYDSVCNRMKSIYFEVYPNSKLLKTPFKLLKNNNIKNNLIQEYNKLSQDLWLNENDFPKYHTENYDIIFYTRPDLSFIYDTSFTEYQYIYSKIKNEFKPYSFSCVWENKMPNKPLNLDR